MPQSDIKNMIKNAGKMAALPATYIRLGQVIDHPYSSARDIARVISEDTSLTARLLQLANSALFNFPKRIETIDAAISLLGTLQLRELALATAVVELFSGIPQNLVDMESFWSHSLACGICARLLAQERHESNVDKYFAAGLLHDIGSMLIYLTRPVESKTILTQHGQTGEEIHSIEMAQLGFDHAAAGAALLEHWNLPDCHIEAVAYHHKPTAARRFPLEADFVHIADIIVNAMQYGSSGEKNVPTLAEEAWFVLGFKPDCLAQLIDNLDTQFMEIDRQMKRWGEIK